MTQLALDPNKSTILIVSDSAVIHSGLGRVVREIFTPLHALGKWNIVQLGWFHTETTEKVPWQIIPTKRVPDGKPVQSDALGAETFEELVQAIKPNLVWSFADPWAIAYTGTSPQRSKYELIMYTCIDSEPLAAKYHNIYRTATLPVTFGKWPHRVLLESAGIESEIIPHGVNLDTYHPDPSARARLRPMIVGNRDDKIVIGTVARNQPRKNLGMMFELMHHLHYGRYAICKTCNRVTLYDINPCTRELRYKPDKCRWCRSDDLQHKGIDDRWIWYYHGAPVDVGYDFGELRTRYALDPVLYLNANLKPTLGVSDVDLNAVYNAMDIFVLPTSAEGFSLCSLESMAAGTPIVQPAYSAYMDWAPAGGLMVDVAVKYVDHQVNATRVMPSMEHMIKCVLELADPERRKQLGQSAIEKAKEYDWKVITPLWEKLFDSILSGPAPASDWRRSISV